MNARSKRWMMAVGATFAVAAGGGATAVASASAQSAAASGTAQIPPVESNIAGKSWVKYSASSGEKSASLAADDDEATAWKATGPREQWLRLDLGGAYDNLRKVRVVFPTATATYRYVVEASANGAAWTTIADRSRNAAAGPGEDQFVKPGIRFVRVRISGASPGAAIGVAELKVYNYLRPDLVVGADISYADQDTNQDHLTYYVDDPATATDVLTSARNAGMRYVRLRVFNTPRDERTGSYLNPAYQGPDRTLEVARKVKSLGMGLGIDLHYSDSWADPSKQAKPSAWASLPFDQLVTAVHDYTRDYVERLVAQGTVPDKVAVGNELIKGFLWGSERPAPWFTDAADWCYDCYFNHDPAYTAKPGGGIAWDDWKATDPARRAAYEASWDRFTTLQAAGIRAVHEVAAAHRVQIGVETHTIIDNGQFERTQEFWNQFLRRLKAKGQDIDVMGFSYYSEWHGTPDVFESELQKLAAQHPGYKIDVAETAHPSAFSDPIPNSPYPVSIQGQQDALLRVFQMVNDLPDNRGLGALVWEPAHFQSMGNWTTSAWPVIQWNSSIKAYGVVPPPAPTPVKLKAGDGSLTVTFRPSLAGDPAQLAYQVSVDGGATWRTPTISSQSDGTVSANLQSLRDGVRYTVSVRAVSALGGPGAAASAGTVVLNAPPPGPKHR
ncbi:glycosyl hydrolase 53 family protein [Dactylosporangium sp. NPDC049742]|uniref:glycosyl hydrolase 53 family protein n=1 Tax=Dactylosporangium sp. NPDC049742 TaxID=3154737 RepID=UPI0034459177